MANERVGIDVEINAELSRFERNMKRAGQVVETSTTKMDRSTQRAAKQFRTLEGRLDPAAKAAARLERDTDKVRRALDKGAISSQRAAKVQRQLNQQYEQAIAKTRRLDTAQDQLAARSGRYASTAATASRRTSRFGASAQNAAFQVGDFATQISSGQNATRALAQQLPQLLGGFGVFGAVVGGAVAVAGALAPALFNVGDEASKTEGKVRSHAGALEAFNSVVAEVNEGQKTQAQRLRETGRAAIESAQQQLQAAEAKLQAFKEGEAVGLGGQLLDFLGVDADTTATTPRGQRAREQVLERLGERADEARQRVQELREKLDSATESLQENTGAANDNASALGQNAERQQSVVASLRQQIELEQLSARERFQQTKVTEAQNRAMERGNLLRDEEIDKVRRLAGELYEARNATNDAGQAVTEFGRDLKDAGRESSRFEDIVIGVM